jgi:acylphosphatase
MSVRTVRLIVSGRVQGVGYRFWAERTARELGLRGWVRNLPDGSVEALATGEADAVARMIEACRQGPRAAAVDALRIEDGADDGSTGFTVTGRF